MFHVKHRRPDQLSTLARKTRVTSGVIPCPSTSTSTLRRRALRRAFSAATTSASTRSPFIKSSSPPGLSRGTHSGTKLGQSRHRACGDLVEQWIRADVFRPPPHDRDVLEPESLRLRGQPVGAPLHRFDEHELNVGPCERQDQPGQPGAAADIPHSARTQQGRDERAVDDVARPQALGLERADQAEALRRTARGQP